MDNQYSYLQNERIKKAKKQSKILSCCLLIILIMLLLYAHYIFYGAPAIEIRG